MKLGAMINFASVTSGYRTPRVELGKATTLGKDGHLLC